MDEADDDRPDGRRRRAPWVDAIGHPTGRKIETRPPYAIDMTAVIAAAAANGTMIEINAAPDRRDMNESTPAPPPRPA